jgi:hypothetical protein
MIFTKWLGDAQRRGRDGLDQHPSAFAAVTKTPYFTIRSHKALPFVALSTDHRGLAIQRQTG